MSFSVSPTTGWPVLSVTVTSTRMSPSAGLGILISRTGLSDVATGRDGGALTAARGGSCVSCANTVVPIGNSNSAKVRDLLNAQAVRFKAGPNSK